MVRDAYAASGQPEQADVGAAVQPLDLRSSTANLTQELAQLLAQSMAQGQASKGTHIPATTGSELANLAALVSASQNRRSVQPAFKDGLSSLSYTRPAPEPSAPLAPPPVAAPPAGSGLMAPPPTTGNSLLLSEPHDEEPMPIPSTWRQPAQGDDDRWYRQQLGAAGLGLVAGLIVVVPAVLWLSGLLGGAQTRAVAARQEAAPEVVHRPVTMAAVKQVKLPVATASSDFGASAPPPVETAPPPPRVAALPSPEPVLSRTDELLARAKRRIESGDIAGARDILGAGDAGTSAAVAFMLAETFDPNMLAIWQTRGVEANPRRARALYEEARRLGDSRADQRLDWLTIE